MPPRRLVRAASMLALCALVPVAHATAQQAPGTDTALQRAIDVYVAPYVATHNFAGEIAVARGPTIVYARGFGVDGFAPADTTRYHVASMSMQFTAGAILRLVDQHRLALDARLSTFAPWVRGGDRITIRNLLEQRSGLSDINARADYDTILQRHQTPASLVGMIANDSLRFEPGTRYAGEEHSAYNALALVIERVTGLPFARAMHDVLFAPASLDHSAVDDDSGTCGAEAPGYEPVGVSGLAPAHRIHWSAKAGNGSACTTARDEIRWVRAVFHGDVLAPASRALVADTAGPTVGYGWFRRRNARLDEVAYSMSGRAPGYASYVLYLPREDLTVVALGNVYSSATSDIGSDVAAIALGRPYQPLRLSTPLLPADSLHLAGISARFPADFYQPNAELTFTRTGDELFLHWPSGDLTPLIPVDHDHLIDRAYWEPVTIARDGAGHPIEVTYDRFHGTVVRDTAAITASDTGPRDTTLVATLSRVPRGTTLKIETRWHHTGRLEHVSPDFAMLATASGADSVALADVRSVLVPARRTGHDATIGAVSGAITFGLLGGLLGNGVAETVDRTRPTLGGAAGGALLGGAIGAAIGATVGYLSHGWREVYRRPGS